MADPSPDPNSNPPADTSSHCSIVGLKGILIQLTLGVLSFSVLIIKRHCEHPKRPWKIWRFDTVKQVISQLLAHFINLTISLALTSNDPDSDNCLWYFITNVFDNTVGVLICVLGLRLLQKLFWKKRKYFLISGNYYEIKQSPRRQDLALEQTNQIQQKLQLAPPVIQINYKAWLLQLTIWNSIVIFTKVLLFVLEYLLENVLDKASVFLLGWIENYPNLQLVAVIVVVPVIMNGLAFWIQDNFLKKREIPHDDQLSQIIENKLNVNMQMELQQISSNHDGHSNSNSNSHGMNNNNNNNNEIGNSLIGGHNDKIIDIQIEPKMQQEQIFTQDDHSQQIDSNINKNHHNQQ